jgi:transposase
VIDAELWAEIRRLHFREHLSQRAIARQLAVAPKTVRNAIRQERFEPAKRKPRRTVIDPYKDAIRALLVRNPEISAVRLCAEARALGYGGSQTVLNDFVRSVRPPSTPEAFLRLSFPPGDAAQVDWTACGSILVEGKPQRLSAFLYVLCHSRVLYVELTLCEQLEVFLACHERAFAATGGVPRRILYDNLRSVVLAHVGSDVRFNPRFLDFSAHYGFKPVACAPYRPNEKGRVENAAKYFKQSFVLGRTFADLDAGNRAVRVWLEEVANVREHRTTRRRPADLLVEERPLLAPLPRTPYDTRVVRTVRASPLCRVHFDGNSYSVPPAVAGAALTLKATATEVVIYARAEEVARHARSEGKGHDVIDPAHVKALLDAKRRGDRGALVHQFVALGPVADAYLSGLVTSELALYRHLRRILALIERFGREEVLAAIAHAQGFRAFGADYVEHIVVERRRRKKRPPPPGPLSLPRSPELERITLEEIDLSLYDRAHGTGAIDAEPRDAGGATQAPPPLPPADPHPRDLPEGPRDGGEGEGLRPRDP